MQEEKEQASKENPKSGTLEWLWETIKYYAKKYVDGLILAGIAAVVGYGLALFFRPPVTVALDQSSLGNHCAKQLFEAADADGVQMTFDSHLTRAMTVCGKGTYQTGRMEASLRYYLTDLYPQCFTNEISPEGVFQIKANYVADGGAAEKISLTNGKELIACRCFPEQTALILRERDTVCGVETK